MRSSRLLLAAAPVGAAALLLAGCAGPAADTEADEAAAPEASLSVVAATDVYGSIAELVGGDAVEVTSIVSGTAQDPHSYEGTAQDQLAISRADVIVQNGGGYDPYMQQLLEASGNEDAVVLDASELSGLMPEEGEAEEHAEDEHAHDHEGDDHAHEDGEDGHEGHDHVAGFNEHVWYDFGAVRALADELAATIGELEPDAADAAAASSDAFAAQLDELGTEADGLAADLDGADAALTEPVPGYLLERLGLTNVTPEAFSAAVEGGTDVSPSVLHETIEAVSDPGLAFLAVNSQTAGPESEQVAAAAEEAGVPVVEVTETLPDGEDYVSWMTGVLDDIRSATGA